MNLYSSTGFWSNVREGVLVVWVVGVIGLISSCTDGNSSDGLLFRKMPSNFTGIEFKNELQETEHFNITEYLYFYNGGGVAIGDINRDGLPDIYFSSNQSFNKLYLNKGNFQFEDITLSAGVSAEGNWKTGVAMVDINSDGWLDIFSCGVGNYKNFDSRNQVFVNQGNNTFLESAEALGLAFKGFSTQVAFLDYDLDGDIDVYLLNHSVHTVRSYGDVSLRKYFDEQSGDKLYENQLVPSGHTYFKPVTQQAGIHSSRVGYGLGVGISDLNNDGWPDIYVSNDFHENDYIYLNNRDKTFQQVAEKSMAHTSRFSMGNDIADINNDGLFDIITLDMLPKDEFVRKASAGEDPFEIFQYKLRFGFHPQLARNALQLNRGNDESGIPMFSDIAMFAGVESTDWSWAPLLADFDNDGNKDLFIANGIRRRPNDMDYINFISNDSVQRFAHYTDYLAHMPEGKVPNVFFKNRGGAIFDDVSESWIGTAPDFSNGSAYGDLDNDGDLDLVVNNINQQASVFQNQLTKSNRFLKIKLVGPSTNPYAIGTKVYVYRSGKTQVQELFPVRGWQSTIDYGIHFGLGIDSVADSVVVQWTGGKLSTYVNVKSGFRIFNYQEASGLAGISQQSANPAIVEFSELIKYKHVEDDYFDFEEERLIPQAVSTQGPKISIGDLNNDGLDDIIVGGATNQPTGIFLQSVNGSYYQKVSDVLIADSRFEDAGISIFDFNGDEQLDVMIANGVNRDSSLTGARLYEGTGNGKFVGHKLPSMSSFASCIRPNDIDGDGDIDVFVGGRKVPQNYGLTPQSYLLINNGKGEFFISKNILPNDGFLGMVTDAKWEDLNNDERPDLVLSGEWMPITLLYQENGVFIDKTSFFGLALTQGWWNCVELADVDSDGDVDIIGGNLGLNSRFRPTANSPIEIFVVDIDGNGSSEQIVTYNNDDKSYPFVSREQLLKQVPALKRKFLRYRDFKTVAINDLISPDLKANVTHRQIEMVATTLFKNNGNNFEPQPLTSEHQLTPIFSLALLDVNSDRNLDLVSGGNLLSVQPELGQYDAGFAGLSIGNGQGSFKPQSPGLFRFLKAEIRDIKVVKNKKNEVLAYFSTNNGPLRIFRISDEVTNQ